MRIARTVALLAAITGCTSTKSVTQGIEEQPRMIEADLRHVPIGTPVDEAQRFMEQEGFDCMRCINDSFLDRKGLDYIHCDRSDRSGIIERRWQLALVHREGKVIEVLATTGLIGP